MEQRTIAHPDRTETLLNSSRTENACDRSFYPVGRGNGRAHPWGEPLLPVKSKYQGKKPACMRYKATLGAGEKGSIDILKHLITVKM